MQIQVQADCALQCLSHAACKERFKGRHCEDVAQQRGFSVDIGCTAKGQGEQTCSKGTGGRKGEQGRPAGSEARNAGTAGGSRGGPRAEAREKSDKGSSFNAPAATELEDDKLASRRLSELWVGALLGFARDCECSAGSATCGPAGSSSRSQSQGGDQSSVNCKLRAPPSASPLAMTSKRRSSCRAASTLRSRSRTLRATVAPASRQRRAAARSRGPPLTRRTPDRGHAARWSPNRSYGCRQRQHAAVGRPSQRQAASTDTDATRQKEIHKLVAPALSTMKQECAMSVNWRPTPSSPRVVDPCQWRKTP